MQQEYWQYQYLDRASVL